MIEGGGFKEAVRSAWMKTWQWNREIGRACGLWIEEIYHIILFLRHKKSFSVSTLSIWNPSTTNTPHENRCTMLSFPRRFITLTSIALSPCSFIALDPLSLSLSLPPSLPPYSSRLFDRLWWINLFLFYLQSEIHLMSNMCPFEPFP